MTELFPSPPVDKLTHHLCLTHGLVQPDDLNAGVYRLRDSDRWLDGRPRYVYVTSAEEMPQRYWYYGIPMLEVTLTGHAGPQVLVGRMDVCEVEWCVDPDWPPGQATWTGVRYGMQVGRHPPYVYMPKIYLPSVHISPGLLRVRQKTPGWHAWARHLAMRVEMHRPHWDAYLDWKADREHAQAKAVEDAEEEAIRAEIDADADAGHFTGV